MARARVTEKFERLAFESALREHPGDQTAALAYTDWLCENGYKLLGAKCIVTKIVREETEKRQMERVAKLMATDPRAEQRIRECVLRRCNTRFLTDPRIRIIAGGLSPTWIRETHTGTVRTTEGTILPANVNLLGDVTRFAPVMEVVTVGAAWVLNILEPPSKQPRRGPTARQRPPVGQIRN